MPRGSYTVSNVTDRTVDGKGPHYVHFSPDDNTRKDITKNGRTPDEFGMHGNNAQNDASKGCLICPPGIRQQFQAGQTLDVNAVRLRVVKNVQNLPGIC
jgi:hypothetical protein